MTFERPLWLLLVPLAVGLVLHARRSEQGRGRRWSRGLRAAAVACLALAMAGPQLVASGGGLDVTFLVDGSDSVGAAGRQASQEWIAAALADRPEQARVALAMFGRDARLDHGLRHDPPGGAPAVEVDPSATDVARALRLAQGVLGSQNRRRVVLLSDGRPTQGDVVAAARDLADAGIRLDVALLDRAGTADAGVTEVVAPGRVRKGEAYHITVSLRSTAAAAVPGELILYADGEPVAQRRVTLPPGDSEVSFRQVAQRPGTVRYEAQLRSGGSTVAQNDRGRAAVQVAGPPRVLVFEGNDGVGSQLDRALRSAGVPVDRRSASREALPAIDKLLDYDGVVLVDVPAAALGARGMSALDSYVRDAGRGLVAIGGERSFGMGGYDGTPLEEVLPVFAQVSDPKKRQSVAEALVVDTSGSMAACHCTNGVAAPEQGGVNKTDIAKEAVAKAASQLEGQDQLGVLAFNTGAEWVIPLQNLPPQAVIDKGLAKLNPEGNTDIAQAVREGIKGLRDAEARLRHIVLFSDGFVADTDTLLPVAREAAAAGITLSVVATGEGPPDLQRQLRRMASIGGGRFYPGRDLASIPTIIALELRLAVRPIINEGSFFPTVTASSPLTDTLRTTPPLAGYLATTAKPTARTLLAIGEERDPLLATWRAGLGTSTAWLSDAAPKWSAQWVTWERFSSFWADVVKSTFAPRTGSLDVEASAAEDGVHVSVTVPDAPAAGAHVTATVAGPDNQRRRVQLDRTGTTTFAGVVDDAGAEGVYAVAAELSEGQQSIAAATSTATRAYAAEYALGSGDDGSVARAADITGGRVGISPADAFTSAGLAPGRATTPLWPLLALLGLVLAVTDVGVARLRLERDDARRALAWVRGLSRRSGQQPVVQPQRDAATDALFAARARARERQEGTSPKQEIDPPAS